MIKSSKVTMDATYLSLHALKLKSEGQVSGNSRLHSSSLAWMVTVEK